MSPHDESVESASASQYKTIMVDRGADGITTITLNRPEVLNALNDDMTIELTQVLDDIHRDEACRVVILTGAGRGFCAGLDLKNGYGDETTVEREGPTRRLYTRQCEIAAISQRLVRLRQPVIAAVNGAAAGGGLAWVLASDVRIASVDAVFSVSFVRIGFSGCDMGTSWLLPRLVGAGRAHELMLTGRRFDAREAERIGLLAAVVSPQDLMSRARATAAEILQNAPMAVEMTKQGMWIALETPSFDASVEFENRQQVVTGLTADHDEAVDAFKSKRAPRFRYR